MKFIHILLGISLLAALTPTFAQDEGAPLFRHVVLFKFKTDTTDNDIQRIVDEFVLLKDKIDVIVDLEWGITENVEPLNDGFTHGFLVSFKDRAGLEAYLPHAAHQEFVALLKPKLDKVLVFDYTAN